jgi:hypothetical protein
MTESVSMEAVLEMRDYIRQLEQKLAEANKQEPVIDKSAAVRIATALGWEPQRQWVDLTDDEMLMIYGQHHEGKKYSLGRMVQQALKEKNT